MSEISISSINSALLPQLPEQLEAAVTLRPGAWAQEKPTVQLQAEVLTQAEAVAVPKPGAPSEPKLASADEKSTLPVINGSSITLHFRVDDETNELTVFVIDQESKRVLRSIPASELQKMKAGDLLKLTA